MCQMLCCGLEIHVWRRQRLPLQGSASHAEKAGQQAGAVKQGRSTALDEERGKQVLEQCFSNGNVREDRLGP